ncbi:MoaD/ThiS family protein [Haloarchaeobius sp. DFWS5]|uniref:MoaD/ThiS family protein n=1 Tax=Haloarchaeobius sp. DFWS5 TaxID=3446114 RepID=UPI003EB942F2
MNRVTVRIPGLLTRFTDGARTSTVDASTVEDCVSALVDTYPALETHLFDGRGDLRSHIHLICNGRRIEWPAPTTISLDDGDEVVFLQAVSGG